MKIVMLGHTGVGKTTYMASLYGVMQQNVEGFRLKAVNQEDHTRWLELAESIRVGKYPLSTDQRNEYAFHLRYKGTNVLQFSWSDYRGGAIRETQDSEQAKLLIQDLKAANGIMLFCDCNAIAIGNTRSNQIGRMIALASHALQDLEEPISIGIILTKVDLVTKFTEQFINPFQGLIDAINASELVTGALIPIACGTQLCNVPMPLLFVLESTVSSQANSLRQSFEKHTSQAEFFEKSSKGLEGIFDWISSKASGVATNKKMAASEKEKAMETLREFESIKKPAESLTRYIQKLPLIKPERSVNQYVEELSQTKLGIRTDSIGNLDPFSVFN